MGLSGSKKCDPKKQGNSSVETRCHIDRPIFSPILSAAQRFLPDYFFVTETISSMFVDEDGDIANEFYFETTDDSVIRRLVKKLDNLRPQGCVRYEIPRLHPDAPFVIWEVSKKWVYKYVTQLIWKDLHSTKISSNRILSSLFLIPGALLSNDSNTVVCSTFYVPSVLVYSSAQFS